MADGMTYDCDPVISPCDEFDSVAPPGRLNDLVAMVQAGDIEGTAASVRDMTSFPLSEQLLWGVIAVAGINAMANLMRRTQPLAQPIANALGEKMMQPKDV